MSQHTTEMPSQKDESASQKNDNTSQKKLGASRRTTEIADCIGIDRRNVQEHIKKLGGLGLIHREGGRNNGKWIIDKSS